MTKKSIFSIVLAVMVFFAAGIVHADQIDGMATNSGAALPVSLDVYVNPGGTGDALIYGYYNARGAFNFIRVVNTSTSSGVAAKVRFREGADSNEVLDFAICLSAGDQWSAWVVDDIASEPATLYWYDSDTPTYPDPQGDNDATNNFLAPVDLKYAPASAATVSADDTKEGYLEIIAARAWDDTPGASKIVKTPQDCQAASGIGGTFAHPVYDAPNSLAGNLYIFNLADGAGTYAYNATALADFRNLIMSISLASDSQPRLDDAEDGLVGVNYVLTKANEYAIYDVESGLEGATDIINTFPTKRLSIQNFADNGPFNDIAVIETDGSIGNATARCETIDVTVWDDQENVDVDPTGFSPGETTELEKCDEVNVIAVGSSSLLDSSLVQFSGVAPSGFELGWIGIDLTDGGNRFTTVDAVTTFGLPVISYSLNGFVDGYFTHMLPLRYTTDITVE